MGYDQSYICIKRSRSLTKSEQNKNTQRKLSKTDDFCYKMYNDWTQRDTPFDIPVLIMDNNNLLKNKDIYTIPRFYAKYSVKKSRIPFVYQGDKYVILNKYFRTFLKKEVPSCDDFKKLILEKSGIEEHQEFYESVNLFSILPFY